MTEKLKLPESQKQDIKDIVGLLKGRSVEEAILTLQTVILIIRNEETVPEYTE